MHVGLLGIVYLIIAQAQPMLTSAEDMHFARHARAAQGGGKHQAVFHRHQFVRPGMPQEGGRRIGGDVLFKRHHILELLLALGQQALEGIAMRKLARGNYRIAEAHRVRTAGGIKAHLMPARTQMGGRVAAGGKAHHRDLTRIAQPLLRLR